MDLFPFRSLRVRQDLKIRIEEGVVTAEPLKITSDGGWFPETAEQVIPGETYSQMPGHLLIGKVLTSLETYLDGLKEDEKGRTPLGQYVEFFREFADRCHHEKEEDHLFTEMSMFFEGKQSFPRKVSERTGETAVCLSTPLTKCSNYSDR